ncbi:unnamed protein product [Musa acuminata subsp. burmannicoides]
MVSTADHHTIFRRINPAPSHSHRQRVAVHLRPRLRRSLSLTPTAFKEPRRSSLFWKKQPGSRKLLDSISGEVRTGEVMCSGRAARGRLPSSTHSLSESRGPASKDRSPSMARVSKIISTYVMQVDDLFPRR